MQYGYEPDHVEQYKLAKLNCEQGNYELCLSILESLISSNFSPAITLMGYIALNGLGVEKNRSKARSLFLRAASQSHNYAKAYLIRMDIEDGGFLTKIYLIPKGVFISLKVLFSNKGDIKSLF